MEMFNVEVKEEFMSNYPEKSRGMYKRIFQRSSEIEQEQDRDLFSFDLDSVESLLYSLSPSTEVAAKTNISCINVYITWAIHKGHAGFNCLDVVYGDQDWHKQFVTPDLKLHVSEPELRQIEDFCVNAQDAVIFRLLFEGAYGKACSELCNLKYTDVDFATKELTLTDSEGSVRKLQVSQRCLDLIKDAWQESYYYKSNGLADVQPNQRDYAALMDGDFVLRSVRTKSTEPRVNNLLITRRLNAISEMFGLSDLTPKTIVRSGMLHMAYQLSKGKGKLLRKHYDQIAARYMVTHWYTMKSYVNMENIETLYGKECE